MTHVRTLATVVSASPLSQALPRGPSASLPLCGPRFNSAFTTLANRSLSASLPVYASLSVHVFCACRARWAHAHYDSYGGPMYTMTHTMGPCTL